jgi:hypothetical protein
MSFTVERRRSRGAAPKLMLPRPPQTGTDKPLNLADIIARVAHIKDKVSRIRGLGYGVDQFTEDKSDSYHALKRLEDDLRRRGIKA